MQIYLPIAEISVDAFLLIGLGAMALFSLPLPWFPDETLVLPPLYVAGLGVAFAIMVAMLIWRPSGLFKGKVF